MGKLNERVKDFLESQVNMYYDTNELNDTDIRLPSNVKVGYHTEQSYNSMNDIDLYVVAQPAVPSGDIVKHTFVIELQVVDKYSSVVFDMLCDIIQKNNRNIIINNEYKFYANYPNIPMKMEDKGINKYDYISFVCTLITYQNVLGVESVYLNNTKIDFTNIDMSYTTNANSNGGLGTGKIRSVIETGTTAYTLIFVPRKDQVYQDIWNIIANNENLNTYFNLRFDNTTIANCVITSGRISQDVSGYPIINLSLARGDL